MSRVSTGNDVVITTTVDSKGAEDGAEKIEDRFKKLREEIAKLDEKGSSPTETLASNLIAVGTAATVAVTAVTAFAGAFVGAMTSCVSAAIELEEKWNNFDREDRMSTKVSDFNEAWVDLKASIGEEFVPGVKDFMEWMTYAVDKMKEGVDYVKDNMADPNTTLGALAPAILGGAGSVAMGGVASPPETEAQKAREARRKFDDEIKAYQRAFDREMEEARDRDKAEAAQRRRDVERQGEMADEEEKERRAREREEARLQRERERLDQQIENAMGRKANMEEAWERGEAMRAVGAGRDRMGKNFRSSIESFDATYNRIAAAAASDKGDPAEEAFRQREEIARKQQELREKHHKEDMEKQDKVIEELEKQRGGLA